MLRFFTILFLLIANLTSAQSLQWAKAIGGPADDRAYSLKVDATGNIYTTGVFSGTADFDPGPATYNLTSAAGATIFISKVDASGNFLWAKLLGGDWGWSVDLDASGNIFVSGQFSANTVDFDPGPGVVNLPHQGNVDVFILKLDASGNFLWAKSVGGPNYDFPLAMGVDALGNVCGTGTYSGTVDFDPGAGTANLTSVGSYDIFILKLNPAGNYIWAKSIGGPDGDAIRSITFDGSNNIHVTGEFAGTADFDPGAGVLNLTSSGSNDIFIAKYDVSGNLTWAKSIGGTEYDAGYSVALDASANLVITGFFRGTADFDTGPGTFNMTAAGVSDNFIAKYNTNGNFLWGKSVASTSGTSIATDGAGNIFAASANSTDIIISRLDAAGNFIWTGNISGPLAGYCFSIKTDAAGNIILTGYFAGTFDFDVGAGTNNLTSNGNSRDIYVAKYCTSTVPAPTANIVQPTCATPTGTINITAPTGAGFVYSINGTTYQPSTSFTGVAPGTYSVTAKNGDCSSSPVSVTINAIPSAPEAPTANVTQQPTCTTPTGTINITAPTGAGLTYSINGTAYQAATTFNSVAPGTYNVTIKDAGGCTSSATSVTVNGAPAAPAAPTASVTQQPTCASSTGTITVTAPTGTGFTYSINGTAYQVATTFNSVPPGTYNVTIKDAGGCTSSATSVTVNGAPAAPAAPTASVTQQPTCATSTGTITVAAPTGTGFTYSINGTVYQAATTFNNVTPGTHNVTVKDGSGCTSSATSVTVNGAPAAPAAPTASVNQQPTCASSTGTIAITAPTGTGFTYSINGTVYQAATTFNNVTPGTHNVTVKDGSGCTSPATSVTVNGAPAAPAAPTASVTQQPTCASSTGTIAITAPTGAGLTYSTNGTAYQAATTFNNVTPGTYNVTVKDGSGCTSSATSVTINGAPSAPAAPTASVTQQPTCATPSGTIAITAPTGTGLTYSINGTAYQASATFNNVTPGTYNVTVRNASGCTSFATPLTVNGAPAAPPAPTASVTQQPTCASSTGTITVTAPTGTGFTYSINGTAYQAATTFNNVTPGTYNVTVKDGSGCTSSATSVTVNGAPASPPAPTASVTQQPTCASSTGRIAITAPTGAGFTYSINGTAYQVAATFNNVTPGIYNVTVRNASGCTSLATSLTVNGAPAAPAAPTASVTQQPTCASSTGRIAITAPTGAGFTYSINGTAYQAATTFNNVTPGTYNVTVKDGSGCTSSATSVTVNGAPASPAAPTASVTQQPTCASSTGTITVTAPTGTGFTYSINGTAYQAATTFNNVTPGTYNVTVKDGSGCTSSATSVTVNGAPASPPAPTASVTQQPTCASSTGRIAITAPTGAGFTYSINGTAYQATATFNNVTPGTYNVTVRNASGCTSSATPLTVNGAPAAPAAPTASVTQQPSCATPSGTINISAPTGAGFTYSINGTAYQPATTFNNVTPGTYSVTVRNASGCTSVAASVTMNGAPTAPVAPNASVTQQPTCDISTGTINISAPSGSGFTYSINGTAYQPATTFNNVIPGNYNVTVKDAFGCTSSATSVTVNGAPTAPAAPTASVTQQPTCTTPTGTIAITAPTGAGLTYSINGTAYQAATTFNNVTLGTYDVTVKDGSGCTSSATSVTVNGAPAAPVAPTANVTQQPTCATPTGTITVTAPTGTGLTYSINGTAYQVAATFDNVNPGTYNVTVRNASGCTSLATPLTVNGAPAAPAAPTASVTEQPSCATPSGTINITAPTGAGFTYSINGTAYQPATTFNNVTPGTYSVTVRNASGCTSVAASVTMNGAPTAPVAPNASVTQQPTCAISTGTINISAPSGAGFTYSINGTVYQPATTFNNVIHGNYNVTVKDAFGCTSSATSVTVNGAPTAPAAPTASVTQQPTCTTPTGTITIAAPTGVEFTYSINGTTYQPATTFNNIPPGTYNVTARNASGCTSAATFITVNGAPTAPIAPTASVTQQPTCTTPTGTITIAAPTGTGFTYSIDGTAYQAATIFSNVTPGTYNLTAKDASGCTSSATLVTMSGAPSAPAAPTASVAQQPTCATPTASINISEPTGAGFTYSINGTVYQAATTFNNVFPGTYNVTVKDASGCTSSATSVTVSGSPSAPAAPTASVTQQPTCTTPTGTITIAAPAGVGFTYSINGTAYQAAMTFNNVTPGTYNMTVRNAAGCTSSETSVTMSAAPTTPAAPTASVTQQPSCAAPTGTIEVTAPSGPNFTYSINGTSYQAAGTFNNVSPGTYDITVKDVDCVSPATIAVIIPVNNTISINTLANPISCGQQTGSIIATASNGKVPYLYSIDGGVNFQPSNIFNGLGAGVYNIIVKDAGGCTTNSSVTITQLVSAITATILSPDIPCEKSAGSITVNATNGVLPYAYSIDGGLSYQPGNTFTQMPAGNYKIIIKDATGCSTSATATLKQNLGFSLNLTATPNPVLAGKVIVAHTSAPVLYELIEWQPSNLFPNQYLKTQNFSSDTSTILRVIGRTASGCFDTAYIDLQIVPLNDIYIPSAFTPNNDGKNDFFKIFGSEIKELHLGIFNRLGERMFETKDKNKGWDGRYKGILQPNGVYIFTLKAVLKNGSVITKNNTLLMMQ